MASFTDGNEAVIRVNSSRFFISYFYMPTWLGQVAICLFLWSFIVIIR